MGNLLFSLRKLGKTINANIEYPNYGGCAVIAGMVGLELERLGLTVDVVTPFSVDGWNIGLPACKIRDRVNNRNNARDWNNNGLSTRHFAVRFRYNKRVYTWDSESLIRGAGYFGDVLYETGSKLGEGLTPTEAAAMAGDYDGWNPSFDRNQIVGIRQFVNECFERVRL